MTVSTFLDGRVVLHAGDCREVMRTLPEASVDSIVCDPPYGLGFMGKKWDTPGALVQRKAATENKWDHVGGNHNPSNSTDQVRTRLAEGVLYQEWCELWATEALRALKPGGHLLAFSSTRTYHRMTCAIEDSGFEIRDQIGWTYGSGFNKQGYIRGRDGGIVVEGWAGGLKPAWEPICVARKPLIGTVAENLARHGVGAFNVDGCRVEGKPEPTRFDPKKHGHDGWRMTATGAECAANESPLGRWPANIIHDGSDEVLACFPESDGQLADAKTSGECNTRGIYGKMNYSNGRDGEKSANKRYATNGGTNFAASPGARRGDTGSAARFFYTSKADADDRLGSKHPTIKPVDLMQYLVRLVTPKGGTVLDPFAGTGPTGEAAWREGMKAILIEREPEYQEDIARRMDLILKPTKRAAVAKTKNKLVKAEDLPLFGGAE